MMKDGFTDFEINALVAKRIMGCESVRVGADNRLTCCCKGLVHGGDVSGHIPNYASDIAAALQVESRIKELGKQSGYIESLSETVAPEYASIFTSAIELDPYVMELDGHAYLWLMVTATPKQRCLAALQAFGVEVEG